MAGRPRLFRKQLILFERLLEPVDRQKLKLVMTPLWVKIGPCPPEFDKKDLMHAVGSTFGGLLSSEINGEFCRIRIQFDVQKQLRKSIFISSEGQGKI